ncbi:hypothetical protein D9O50_01650 [Oxalobacteraceae bacterium CAVE-383]|nr:hypothetical protein D9O50_01650 [Oxalobacteraceae bacterium CAVE-383]
MSEQNHHVAVVDKRPFFERALSYGLQQGLLERTHCEKMIADGAKGSVQVADFFGSSHLHADLENARRRIVNLVSLYLEQQSNGDLQKAAQSLRDNTFLSHSRGGNEMLKALHAMPDSTVFGDVKSQPVKDFQDERTLAKPFSLAAYRKQLQSREQVAAVMGAAQWLAGDAGLDRSELDFVSAESVIRSAVLMRAAGVDGFPDRVRFAKTVEALRQKALAAGKFKLAAGMLDDLPASFRPIADKVRRNIEKNDAPLFLDAAAGLDRLLNDLETRYFVAEGGLDDVADFDAFVSKEWHRVMQGKEDPYSRLTAFMCIAAGMAPKTSLAAAEAKSLIRKVREHGFASAAVSAFIRDSAPFDLKDNLLALWEDEFLPEAELALLDEDDLNFVRGLAFLRENCNIKAAPAPRKSAGH